MQKRQQKGHAPPGEFFALGKSKGSTDTESRSTASTSHSAAPVRKAVPAVSAAPLKREAPSTSTAPVAAKKPRLGSTLFAPLGRAGDGEYRASPVTTQVCLYEDVAVEVEAHELMQCIEEALERSDADRTEALLCGAVKHLKSNRSKPDPLIVHTLLCLAKERPSCFHSELVVDAFCGLLKKEPSASFKMKGINTVSTLSCNILLSSFIDEENWPESFVKVYIDDSLGERVWVDRRDCKVFVDNIMTAFNTRLPPVLMSMTEVEKKPETAEKKPELLDRKLESTSNSPVPMITNEDSSSCFPPEGGEFEFDSSSVFPRYMSHMSGVELHVLELMRDQLTKRQPTDGGSRNLVRTLTMLCGYAEIRSMVAPRLELWLQNPKLTRAAQDLMMAVCMNADQQRYFQDVEVTNQLIRLRLKTKALINSYLSSIRELIGQNVDTMRRLMSQTIYNELSPARNPNNMSLISVMFSHKQDLAASLLAELFLDMLMTREDNLRSLRALLREIARVTKQDFLFNHFTSALVKERTDNKFTELDTLIKERCLHSIIDLTCVTMLVSITPQIREVLSHVDNYKENELVRGFQRQISMIQCESLEWLHTVVPKLGAMKATDYLSCIKKLLFIEKQEVYFKVDNWPPENERSVMFRLVSEVPVLEDTLIRILLIGSNKDFHVGASEAIETVEMMVRRAAGLHKPDFPCVVMERVDLFEALFNLCCYRYHENISLPKGYTPPALAISALYWKSWAILLVFAAFNPTTIGRKGWMGYPILKYLMEMCITNSFSYPPISVAPDEKLADEIKTQERQIVEMVKHQILEFEGHLAAASSSKHQVTESNSLLLSTLMHLDPTGFALRPPQPLLDQVKKLNEVLRIGASLCRSRNPDFLLDIISRQGASQAMPWLAELVEANDSSLDVLPVQCLCEFVLHDSAAPVTMETAESSVEEGSSDTQNKSQAKLKHAQLLGRLQTLVSSTSSDHLNDVKQVLSYFLHRLSSSSSATRKQAAKGLSLVLGMEGEELEMRSVRQSCMERDVTLSLSSFKSKQKLLNQLSNLPLFDQLRVSTCAAIRKACLMDTDAQWVSAYIIFLERQATILDLTELDGVMLDIAQMIVERCTLLNHLIPVEDTQNASANDVLVSMIALFYHYLTRAQQTQNQVYWSNIQDQIRIQWSNGKTATMNILVVHAMIIILTYGMPKGASLFKDMEEVWFPVSGPGPSAYLIDTSEEALLLPDWLKLRMIRSNVPRLVDAALADLDANQLLLFVQSFGIPVSSMSRLLQGLDQAVDTEGESIRQAVSDDSYMIQLVEVQRMRGAVGGERFYSLVCGTPVATPPVEDDRPVNKMGVRMRSISRLSRSDDLTGSQCNVQSVSALLLQILGSQSNESPAERMKKFRILTKSLANDSVVTMVIESLEQLLSAASSKHQQLSAADLMTHQNIACPLFKILLNKKVNAVKLERCVMLVLSGLTNKTSNLYHILSQHLNTIGSSKPEELANRKAVTKSTKMSEQDFIKCLEDASQGRINDLESVIGSSIEDNVCITANGKAQITRALCLTIAQLSSSPESRRSVGLLIDWLEQLHPDLKSSADPDTLLDLLFSGRGVEIGQPYLLTLLLHRGGWENVRGVVYRVLSDEKCVHRYSATAVLDFLMACIDMPRLWQGRDKKLPKNYIMEDVLELTPLHLPALIGYIVSEAMSHSTNEISDNNVRLQVIGRRKKLYTVTCYNKPEFVECAVSHLQQKIKTDSAADGLYSHILLDLYMSIPGGIGQINDGLNSDIQSASSLHETQLDAVSHRLVTSLGCASAGSDSENRMKDANIACRKMAAERPAVLLRQLPMIAALLQGRAHFSFAEIRSRNYLLLYTHVLGLLELLQPHVFLPEHSQSFLAVLKSYFEFISMHGSHNKAILGGILVKFVDLLHGFFNYDRKFCSQQLHQFIPIITAISRKYPDIPALGSLLAGLSLPSHDPVKTGSDDPVKTGSDVKTGSEAEDQSMKDAALSDVDDEVSSITSTMRSGRGVKGAARPPSPWVVAQLMPLSKRLRESKSSGDALMILREVDELSKRRVDILTHFTSVFAFNQQALFRGLLIKSKNTLKVQQFREFDELSKRLVDILTHFTDDIKRLMLVKHSDCRSTAHTLSMRLVRHNPTCASQFKEVVLKCLNSDNVGTVKAMLDNLAEYVLLAREFGTELLEKAFMVGVIGKVDTTRYISETLQMLNMDVM